MRPRPRHNYRRWTIITAAVGVALVIVTYVGYRSALRPVGDGKAQTFTVVSGERAPQVATDLVKAGLIRNRDAFLTYLNLHGLRGEVKAGTYTLQPIQSGQSIAVTLTSGRSTTNAMLVPEGYRLTQIEALAAHHGITTADFEAALAEPHTQPLLASSGKPANVSLEGYLFPDTYQVTKQTTASELVNEMLNTFQKRVGDSYVQAFAAEGLTLHQGLTLASVVEKEVNNPADRPIVAQIFLKRYHIGMPLGSDVTTQYASDLTGVPFNLDVASPYNTRKYAGLPPGPICNPGLAALDAVAHPAATDYLYFVTGNDGVTYYARTLAQHNQNVAQHLK